MIQDDFNTRLAALKVKAQEQVRAEKAELAAHRKQVRAEKERKEKENKRKEQQRLQKLQKWEHTYVALHTALLPLRTIPINSRTGVEVFWNRRGDYVKMEVLTSNNKRGGIEKVLIVFFIFHDSDTGRVWCEHDDTEVTIEQCLDLALAVVEREVKG